MFDINTILALLLAQKGGNSSGGGNASIATDKSLTQSGMAADAAIVGQKLAEQSEAIADLGGGGIVYNAKTPPEGLTAAVGDGETDDAPALNALVTYINSVGGGILFLPKGTYMVDSRVYWKSNVSLVGEGIGLTILKPRQAAGVGVGFAAISWQGFTASNPMVNCTFRDFTIDGDEMNITSYTSYPKGINIHYVKDCIFRDMVIKNTCATGLGIDNLSNVTMDNIHCYNCGRSFVPSGTEANVGGAGLGIGTETMNSEGFIIRNCICDGCGNYGIFLEDQSSGDFPDESYIITGNIVRNGRNHGIVVKGGSKTIVANNTVYDNANDGIAVLENNGFLTEHIKITNNLCINNGNGFRLESNGQCKDIYVSDNVFTENDYGVVINSPAEDLEIMRNTIKDSAYTGVKMAGVNLTDCVFWQNVVFGNGANYSNSATFSGNVDYNELATPVEPTGIAFGQSSYSVKTGGTLALSVVFTPSNANGSVVYTSGDTSKATISGNILTAIAEGELNVTATCGSLTATCTVTITEASSGGESGNLWDSSVNLLTGYISDSGDFVSMPEHLTYDGLIEVSPNGIYQFTTQADNLSSGVSWRIAEYDEAKTYIQRTIGLKLGRCQVTTETTKYVKITVSGTNGGYDSVSESMASQIKQNSMFIELTADDFIPLKGLAYENKIYNDAGELLDNNNNATTVDYIDTNGATKIEYLFEGDIITGIVCYIQCFDENKVFLERKGVEVSKKIEAFSLSAETKYIKLRTGYNGKVFDESKVWDTFYYRLI